MFLLRSLAVVEQGSEEGAARERSVKFGSEGPLEPAWVENVGNGRVRLD